jgi:type VI secretion system protein ImpF
LIDLEPGSSVEPIPNWFQSFRDLKAAVKRDMEWLLNSRRTPEAVGDELPLARRSVFNFGLPDITSIVLQSATDRARLLRMIEEVVSTYEPRLQDTKVFLDEVAPGSRMLRFSIEGLLRVDPAPERVSFDTLLELSSGTYEVKATR